MENQNLSYIFLKKNLKCKNKDFYQEEKPNKRVHSINILLISKFKLKKKKKNPRLRC